MGILAMIPDDIIIESVLPHLDLTSRVRLAVVSRKWRHLSRLVPLPNTHLPWLIGTNHRTSALILLNLNIGVPYPSIHLPRPPSLPGIHHPGRYVGSVDGNAILAPSSGGIVLYSPFSGETRRVFLANPAFSTIDRVRILPEQQLVVANDCRLDTHILFACRLGQSDWVKLNFRGTVTDFIFHQDKLYCISFTGRIFSFELQDLLTNPHLAIPTILYQPEYILDREIYNQHYHLVESCGDLLVVMEPLKKKYKSKFFVYKVELNQQRTSASLEPVIDLADRMLFVGETCSLSCRLPANLSKFFTKNCIYYIHREKRIRRPYWQVGKRVLNRGFGNLFPSRIPKFRFRPVWIAPHPHPL